MYCFLSFIIHHLNYLDGDLSISRVSHVHTYSFEQLFINIEFDLSNDWIMRYYFDDQVYQISEKVDINKYVI